MYLVEKYRCVVIVGHTGCGKTTQIPQYLFEEGWANNGLCIACTQPRRVAATTVASRVADEMGVELGKEVGYSIRFDDHTDPDRTRIKYLTDGMLLREMMVDPLLSRYSVVMVDEAHERSLHTDIILGLLKKIMRKRKDLRLIVSSATLDAEDFKNFFETNTTRDKSKDSVYIMSVEGRTYPVDIHYTERPVPDYIQAAFNTVLEIHKSEPQGDVLVFLTGQEEIDTLINLIDEDARSSSLASGGRNTSATILALPLYSGLPHEQQMRIFAPAPRGMRKVVVSTNIAETSITIDGIVYVVDCGFVKQRSYNPITNMESLVITEVSQASAQQRAGRAGRTRPGKCYRLYEEAEFFKLRPQTVPEIQRSNLMGIILQLKALGIDDVLHFDFISPPPSESMIRALEILYSLGALDDFAKLTDPIGTQMAEFPVEPMLAKMLLASGEMQCSEEALTIAAMLSVQNVFVSSRSIQDRVEKAKKRFAVKEGDHLMYLNIYDAFIQQKNKGKESGGSKDNKGASNKDAAMKWCYDNFINYKTMQRVVSIRKQLARYMNRFRIAIVSAEGDAERIRKCVVKGFFANYAVRQPDGSYATVRGNQQLWIHPSSCLFKFPPPHVIYNEIVETSKQFMRDVLSIEVAWLTETAPHFYEYK
eukprot:GEZU01026281.1.p1 GENE.GEZU01026281.1~~GEZU01026281.1.p1  ORF type:complete len:648 (-),score=93.75 GEZU01026281.1:63-2006(-)